MHSVWSATQTRAEWEATSSTVAAAGREDKTSFGGRLLLVVMGAALDDFHNFTVNQLMLGAVDAFLHVIS